MLLRTPVRGLHPYRSYAKTFSTSLNRRNGFTSADVHTRGPAWREATSRTIIARTWDTVTLNMIDIFAIIREIERRYGRIQSFEAKRSADVESEYLKYMFIVFQHSESKEAITPGQVIQVKSPKLDILNEDISLEHLAWGLDPVVRDEFLRGSLALPGEKDSVLRISGLPEETSDGSPVEYHVIDIKLEDGFPPTDYRYDQSLSRRRRRELAEAIVSFGGFIDRPKSIDGASGRRPMDTVVEYWAKLLPAKDKAELEATGGINPPAAVEDAPSSSPGQPSRTSSLQDSQDFWFPQSSKDKSELILSSLEPITPVKSYAPPDPSAVLAETLTPVPPEPRPSLPKSEPPSRPSKKERLLMAARKGAEAAALKEIQAVITTSPEIEEITQTQLSGIEPSTVSEVSHPEVQKSTEVSSVPRQQQEDPPTGDSVPREPGLQSARSWLKKWIG